MSDITATRPAAAARSAAVRRRLHALRAASDEPADQLVRRVTTLLSNIAYQSAQLPDDAPLPLADEEVRRSAVELLSRSESDDDETEQLRRKWLGRFAAPGHADDVLVSGRELAVSAAVARLLAGIVEDRARLVRRLSPAAGGGNPDAAFFRVIREIGDPGARNRLAAAWNLPRSRRAGELIDLVDQVVDLRRARARADGYPTPLARTLTRSRLSTEQARSFVRDYVRQAVAGHRLLAAEIRAATGTVDEDPMNHIPFHLRRLTAGGPLPRLALRSCLDVAAEAARRVLDCELRVEPDGDPASVRLRVRWRRGPAGRIQIDLTGGDAAPDGTADGGEIVPARTLSARIRCPVRHGGPGRPRLSFGTAQALFRDLGAALGRIRLGARWPGLSGREYLPVERLEELASWFETWVFHPDFAGRVAGDEAEARGVELCQRVRRLEFRASQVQRVVVAALDLDVHGRDHGGLRESFRRLDEEFSVGPYVNLGDMAGYLVQRRYAANPGMSLNQLWGSAFGAEKFAALAHRRLADLVPGDPGEALLASCFNPGLPSVPPDIGAVRRFHESDLAF